MTQAIWGITPTYSVAEEDGADHNKIYQIVVTLGDVELGAGKGSSKKKGEQDAAENAIANRGMWEKQITLPKKVIET